MPGDACWMNANIAGNPQLKGGCKLIEDDKHEVEDIVLVASLSSYDTMPVRCRHKLYVILFEYVAGPQNLDRYSFLLVFLQSTLLLHGYERLINTQEIHNSAQSRTQRKPFWCNKGRHGMLLSDGRHIERLGKI